MWTIYTIGKWSFLFLSVGLGSFLFMTFVFSLMRVGRRADDNEKKILEIISPARSNVNMESKTAQLTEVPVAK